MADEQAFEDQREEVETFIEEVGDHVDVAISALETIDELMRGITDNIGLMNHRNSTLKELKGLKASIKKVERKLDTVAGALDVTARAVQEIDGKAAEKDFGHSN